MAVDWNVIIQAGSTLGGFALIGKWLLRSAEKSNETLPVILATIKTLQENDKELFKSRNNHSDRIVKIETGIEHCEACNAYKHKRSTDI